jgi:large subunit ribosomal protein L13
MMKTYTTKASEIKRQQHVIDASDKVLGRLASQVAVLLMGKHKPMYTPNLDTGDFVVVTNAEKVRITGNNKTQQRLYYWHSGYPGGFKSISLEKLMQTKPERAIEYAVKGMLPHTRLGARMIRKLTVYPGDIHPQQTKEKATSKE